MEKKNTKTKYTPKNPKDPKIPNLKSDWNPTFFEEDKPKNPVILKKTAPVDNSSKMPNLINDNDPRLVTAAFDSFQLPLENLKYQKNRDFVDKINSAEVEPPAMIEKKFKIVEEDPLNDFTELTPKEIKELEAKTKKESKKDLELKKISMYDEKWEAASEGDLIPALKENTNKAILNMLNAIKAETGNVVNGEGRDLNLNKNVDKRAVNENGYIMPDPQSVQKITSYREFYQRSVYQGGNVNYANKYLNNGRPGVATRKSSKTESRRLLTKTEIKFLVSKFAHLVIKITKYEVILKHLKYGYEIYFNMNDNRWWVVALVFNEPYDCSSINSIKFTTLWSGSSFIGYGLDSLEAVVEKTELLFKTGRTGNIAIREYMLEYNPKTKRIYTSTKPKALTFEEYKTFSNWFRKNRIEIFLKTHGVQDAEDLEQIAYENKKKGIHDARAVLGIKFAIMPRKASYIFAYPVAKGKKAKTDVEKPENKLYHVAFGVTD